MFADQFEPDDHGFVYRKNMQGAAIRVTQFEYQIFVAVFAKRIKRTIWLLVLAILLLIGLLTIMEFDPDSMSATTATFFGVLTIMVGFMFAFVWALNAPARELAHRPQIGAAKTRAEVRQLMFATLTYGQLVFAAVAAVLLAWKASAEIDVLRGWNILWLVPSGCLIVGAAIQAFRKWRHERR